jgi:hypothetical protein
MVVATLKDLELDSSNSNRSNSASRLLQSEEKLSPQDSSPINLVTKEGVVDENVKNLR